MKLKIIRCTTMKSRLIGFMGARKIDKILCFPKCNSVHTFFMKSNIDIYMTDKNNKILFIFKNVKKNKIILPKKGVYYTYETPVGYPLEKDL